VPTSIQEPAKRTAAPVARATVALETGFSQWAFALRRTLITTPVGWMLAMWFCWEQVPHLPAFIWLGIFGSTWSVGLWVLHGVIRNGPRLDRHRQRLLWVAALDGFSWGLSAWFLMGRDPILDATLTTLLCGVSAVNAQVYVTFIRGYYIQAGFMWMVAVAGLAGIAGNNHAIDYAVGYSVFLGLTIYYMRAIAQRVLEGIQLQFANASLAEQLRVALLAVRHDAATDALTGQCNRRALDEILNAQIDVARRSGQALSVLMVDIDFFKTVNDTYGHLMGDDALRAFAQRVREHIRLGDVCARFGGEEFVVVLPGTTLQTALEVAERLRIGVEKTPLLTTPLVSVTVSIGAAALIPDHTADELLNAADAAVYAAKRGGRNQVQSSEDAIVRA
jgi:diguanylate cyclase (GGDEF)-like protein